MVRYPRNDRNNLLDEKIAVVDEDAFETARRLATAAGIFAGTSSGASVAGAIRWARQMKSGTIVALLPDRGDRYLSTNLFRTVQIGPRQKVA